MKNSDLHIFADDITIVVTYVKLTDLLKTLETESELAEQICSNEKKNDSKYKQFQIISYNKN